MHPHVHLHLLMQIQASSLTASTTVLATTLPTSTSNSTCTSTSTSTFAYVDWHAHLHLHPHTNPHLQNMFMYIYVASGSSHVLKPQALQGPKNNSVHRPCEETWPLKAGSKQDPARRQLPGPLICAAPSPGPAGPHLGWHTPQHAGGCRGLPPGPCIRFQWRGT